MADFPHKLRPGREIGKSGPREPNARRRLIIGLSDFRKLFAAGRFLTKRYDEAALMDLVRTLALQIGQFKLASGKMSSYYLDCRKVTLDSAGANLIADGMLELLGNDLPDAVGGMAIG